MSVKSEIPRLDWISDGVTADVPLASDMGGMIFISPGDLNIYSVDASGTPTRLHNGTDYTISGDSRTGGASLHWNVLPAEGLAIAVRRRVDRIQPETWGESDGFSGVTMTNVQDRARLIDQDAFDFLAETVRAHPAEQPLDRIPAIPVRAGFPAMYAETTGQPNVMDVSAARIKAAVEAVEAGELPIPVPVPDLPPPDPSVTTLWKQKLIGLPFFGYTTATNPLTDEIYPGSGKATQAICKLTLADGSKIAIVAQRYNSDNGPPPKSADSDYYHFVYFAWNETAARWDNIGVSGKIEKGHQGLDGYVEAGTDNWIVVGSAAFVADGAGAANRSKGISVFRFKWADRALVDNSYRSDYLTWPADTADTGVMFGNMRAPGAVLSKDGKFAVLFGFDVANQGESTDQQPYMAWYDWQAMQTAGPGDHTARAPLFKGVLENPWVEWQADCIQDYCVALDGYLYVVMGQTPTFGRKYVGKYTRTGKLVALIPFDGNAALYGRAALLDHPTKGIPRGFEVEGIDVEIQDDGTAKITVLEHETWAAYVAGNTRSWHGLNFASLAAGNKGHAPNNPSWWQQTAKAAGGAWDKDTTYGDSGAVTFKQAAIWEIAPWDGSALPANSYPCDSGILIAHSDAKLPLSGGRGQTDIDTSYGGRFTIKYRASYEGRSVVYNGLMLDWPGWVKNFDAGTDNTDNLSWSGWHTARSATKDYAEFVGKGSDANDALATPLILSASWRAFGSTDPDLPYGWRVFTGPDSGYSVQSDGYGAFRVRGMPTGKTLVADRVTNFDVSRDGRLIANANLLAAPASVSSATIAQFVGPDGDIARLEVDSFGATPVLSGARRNGVNNAPTALLSADTIVAFNGYGHYGSGMQALRGVGLDHAATENWDGTHQGARSRLVGTKRGTTTVAEHVGFDPDNGMTMGATPTVVIDSNRILRPPSYTVSTLPSAAIGTGLIHVSNEAGGAVLAFSDNTNWRRVTDRAVVS